MIMVESMESRICRIVNVNIDVVHGIVSIQIEIVKAISISTESISSIVM